MVAESFQYILQCTYENARTTNCSVIYIVVEQVRERLLHQDVVEETLNRRFSTNFNTASAADKVF